MDRQKTNARTATTRTPNPIIATPKGSNVENRNIASLSNRFFCSRTWRAERGSLSLLALRTPPLHPTDTDHVPHRKWHQIGKEGASG